ncbi:MAG: plastocyanin/azurin family copper-binding protein [Balneolaceae bacterium]|nr:plastocyanin/azurin family copper-binding protein [Balneolaceae bacterium]
MKTLIKTTLTLFLAVLFMNSGFAQSDDIRTITVIGQDNMQFSETLIEAEPGETIRIVLDVKSNMPPQAMSHNLAIVDLDTNVEEFVLASMAAPDTEYIAPEYEEQVIATTSMIGGGETSTIEFTVPDNPGEYEYVCTFPGHYFGGMKGILRVAETS